MNSFCVSLILRLCHTLHPTFRLWHARVMHPEDIFLIKLAVYFLCSNTTKLMLFLFKRVRVLGSILKWKMKQYRSTKLQNINQTSNNGMGSLYFLPGICEHWRWINSLLICPLVLIFIWNVILIYGREQKCICGVHWLPRIISGLQARRHQQLWTP